MKLIFSSGETAYYFIKSEKRIDKIKYNPKCHSHRLMSEWGILYKTKEDAEAALNNFLKNKYKLGETKIKK